MAGPPPVYEKLSPDGRWFVGDKDNNLYLRSTADRHIEALTEDGAKDFDWDSNRVLWSPDSRALAAVKTDRRNIPLYPVVHWLSPAEQVEWVRLDGRSSGNAKYEFSIIDIASRKRLRFDGGLFRGWRADGSELLVTTQGLKQFDFVTTVDKIRRFIADKDILRLGCFKPQFAEFYSTRR